MKFVLDVLASTVESGGMKLHATEMIRAWKEEYPADHLVIHGPKWIIEEFSSSGSTLIVSNNESPLLRSFNQLFRTAHIARKYDVDAVVSFSPIVTPFVGTRQSVAFQHDWRHKLNPREFPLVQRAYRKLWEISSRRADFNACISEKAELETLRFASGSKTFLCPNGRDHARRWNIGDLERRNGTVVTYGHHNNKRPELVISALGLLRVNKHLPEKMRLIILGAKGEYQKTLISLAEKLNIIDVVDFPGFVSDQDYVSLVGRSSVVVLVSTDEGFGLPVAEAEYLSIPAVISSDSGMADIFGDAAIVAYPNFNDIAEAIIAAWNISEASHAVVEEHPLWRWGDAVGRLRGHLASSHSK